MALLTLAFGLGSPLALASADEPGSEFETVGDEFGTSTASGYDPKAHERWHVDQRIKAARITLITSAVLWPVGAAIFFAGAAACSTNSIFEGSCTSGQAAALGLGGAFFLGASIGLITGGILLGIANKRRRELDRAQLRFHWDVQTSRFVF